MNATYAIILFGSAVLSSAVSWFAWRRRPAPGAAGLAFLGAALAVWSFTYAVSWTVPNPELQYALIKLSYIGVVSCPPAVLLLVLGYTRQEELLTPWARAILIAEPLLTLLILGTDSLHGLFFGGFAASTRIYEGGPWFWFNAFYGFGIVLIATAMLVSIYSTQQPIYKKQTAIIIAAVSIPALTALISMSGFAPILDIDLTPFAFTLSSLLLVFGLFHFGLLDVIPIARDQLIDSMSEGIIVFDEARRVVDINHAACQMTHLSPACLGKTADELFWRWSNEIDILRSGAHKVQIELKGNPRRYIEASLDAVRSQKNGSLIASLVMLRDVSDRVSIATAEHEQRALAEALRDTAEVIGSTLEFDEVLDRILESVEKVVAHDACAFFFYDAESDSLTVRRAQGYLEYGSGDILDRQFALSDRPVLTRMYETREPVVLGDAALELEWTHELGTRWAQSIAATPLFIQDDFLGFLIVESGSPNAYSLKHAESLHALGHQAAVAIQNALLHAQLQSMATSDALTGVLNRYGLIQLAEREVQRAQRSGAPLALIVIDVDNFKETNDQYGHLVGDEVLRGVVDCCLVNVRAMDVVARFGGDEVVLLLPETDKAEGFIVGNRIREALCTDGVEVSSGERVAVTVSVGLAVHSGESINFYELFNGADSALYSAKRAGGNQVLVAE